MLLGEGITPLEWVWIIRIGEGGWWLSCPGAESLGPLRWAERRLAPVNQPGCGDDLGLEGHHRGPMTWVTMVNFHRQQGRLLKPAENTGLCTQALGKWGGLPRPRLWPSICRADTLDKGRSLGQSSLVLSRASGARHLRGSDI